MPDTASEKAGGKVFFISSLDPAHPGENIIDGRDGTYWISTGLFPQEIILRLGQPTLVVSLQLRATGVRAVTVEGSSEERPLNFKALAEAELADAGDRLQVKELRCDGNADSAQPSEWIRLVFASGWGDFCSVHKIAVEGEASEVVQRRSTLAVRRATLDVSAAAVLASPEDAAGATGAAGPAQSEKSGLKDLEVRIPEKGAEKELTDHPEPNAPREPDNVSVWGPAA
mmetsp:Transcript_143/g.358  ORF Transcript_143/g.358 Transcript_143/m.358 type:complete len:228 (+) Transcript_143:70-753(+)